MKTLSSIGLLITVCVITLSGQASSVTDTAISEMVSIDKVEKYLTELQAKYGIPGATVAMIKDGKVIYKGKTGYANLEHQVPISHKSIYRLYSLTKPFIAVAIFQLMEQGKLEIDDEIGEYVDGLPEKWNTIQISNLLSHSSGLPDMAGNNPYEVREVTEEEAKKRVFAMPMEFQPGERFQYNQTNFWLLKEIIENLTTVSLADHIVTSQFSDASREEVFFSSDSRDIVRHRVTPYFPFAKGYLIADLPYTQGDYMHAANSLHCTIEEFIKWDRRFANNEFISAKSKEAMWKIYPYTNSYDTFTYGWGVAELEGNQGYGFSGSMSTIYQTFPKQKLSIILLTNGFTKWYDLGAAVQRFASFVHE